MTYDRRCKAFRQPCSMGHGSNKSGNNNSNNSGDNDNYNDNNTFSWEKAVHN